MLNHQFMQITDSGYRNIIHKFEQIKNIEFTGIKKATVTEQRGSAEVNGECESPYLQKMGSRALITIDCAMMKVKPDWFEKHYLNFACTLEIMEAVEEVRNDEEIETIVFAWNCPGGSSQKMHLLAEKVYELSQVKQTASLNIGDMSSAAYFVGSQANLIYVDDRMNETGSIGTKAVAYDYSKMYNDQGIEVIPVVTGPLKAMLHPGTEVTEEMVEVIQNYVNQIQENFNVAVTRMRPAVDLADGAEARSGLSFFYEDAARLGLVDGIKNLSETFHSLEQMQRAANLNL